MSRGPLVGLTPYPEEKLIGDMWEDRFFVPGSGLHGYWGDLVRVYLNDSHSESLRYKDHNQFEYDEIPANLIREAAKEDPGLGDLFETIINENLHNYCAISTDDWFREIVEEWPNSIAMTRQDMVDWASGVYKGTKFSIVDSYEGNDGELYGEIYVCQLGDDIRINVLTSYNSKFDLLECYPIAGREDGMHFYKASNPAEKIPDIVCVEPILDAVRAQALKDLKK